MSRIHEDPEPSPLAERTKALKYEAHKGIIVQSLLANPCKPGVLNRAAAHMRKHMTEYRNAAFFKYALDGDEYHISDGGDDMYDGANFTTPWLLSGDLYVEQSEKEDLPFAVSYAATTETVIDSTFRYVSLGYVQSEGYDSGDDETMPSVDASRHPLLVMGSRCSGPVGWQLSGNMGADGSGEAILTRLHSGEAVEGFRVHAAVRQLVNTGDPLVCNVILLVGSDSWGSRFGPITTFSDEDTNENGFYAYAGTGSKNILAIHFLLSKPESQNTMPISNTELKRVVVRVLRRLRQGLAGTA
jgi:hypothetical protein